MQLQYLCSFSMDAAIRKSLGQFPPNLHTLYSKLYDIVLDRPHEVEINICKNAFHWLLCAQRTMKTADFLAAISIIPSIGNDPFPFRKGLILELCRYFVIFDAQLDTFHFAHLSVREFLEKRQEYDSTASNALAAETCLWNLISFESAPSIKDFPPNCSRTVTSRSSETKKFNEYAHLFWPVHYQLAADRRISYQLKSVLRIFAPKIVIDLVR